MSATLTQPSRFQWPILGLALVPMVVAGWFNSASEPAPMHGEREAASLVFDEYLANYGPRPVRLTPTITVPFFYRNTSDQAISINAIRTSCGCMKPQMDSMKIEPGQAGRLVVPINTINEQAGPHEYLVKLEYTDTKQREVDLAIKMTLPRKEVLIEPRQMLFYQSGNQPTTQTVTITDYRPKAFKVKSIVSNSKVWTVHKKSHVETIDGTTDLVLDVTLDGSVPPGTHRGAITIATDDPAYPFLSVQLVGQTFGNPTAPIAAIKPSRHLVLKPTTRGELAASTPFTAAGVGDVLSVSTAPEFLNATVDTDASGQAIVRVSASVDPAQRTTRVNGRVTIRTKSSEHPTTIPVVIPALRSAPK